MTGKLGILGMAFGGNLSQGSPGSSNWAISDVIKRLEREHEVSVIVVERGLDVCLPPGLRSVANVVSKHRKAGEFLGSEEVISQAATHFRNGEVGRVYVVAHPFLHRHKCVRLVKKEGFEPIVPEMGHVPFDERSGQWWTRGPARTFLYAVLQFLFGRQGK